MCCAASKEAVFTRFDKVLLLETGRVAYYGEVATLRGSLRSLGFACPEGSGGFGEPTVDRCRVRCEIKHCMF